MRGVPSHLYVMLEYETHVDDVQPIIDAISRLRGVVEVTPAAPDPTIHAARAQVKHEVLYTIYQAARAILQGRAVTIEGEPS